MLFFFHSGKKSRVRVMNIQLRCVISTLVYSVTLSVGSISTVPLSGAYWIWSEKDPLNRELREIPLIHARPSAGPNSEDWLCWGHITCMNCQSLHPPWVEVAWQQRVSEKNDLNAAQTRLNEKPLEVNICLSCVFSVMLPNYKATGLLTVEWAVCI